jgi:mono/diheme cytochrome c family protein
MVESNRLAVLVALLLMVAGAVFPANAEEGAKEPAAGVSVAPPEAAAPVPAGGNGAPRDPTEELFSRKCASCHTIGKGVRVGPDLKDVHTRRNADWLKRFIQTPSAMLDTDADARKLLKESNGVRMPDLGLTGEQADAMTALVERCSLEVCDLTPAFTPVNTATTIDFDRGKNLFLGYELLKNGGPPCVVCHSVASLDGQFSGGGTLGKNLTHVFARLGDEGMDAALRSPPFAVMLRIFQEHPLEDDEVFALRSFFYDANRQPTKAAGGGISFIFIGILGALIMLILLNVAWSRRLRPVRAPLLKGRGQIL